MFSCKDFGLTVNIVSVPIVIGIVQLTLGDRLKKSSKCFHQARQQHLRDRSLTGERVEMREMICTCTGISLM